MGQQFKMLKQLQQMQAKMAKVQEDLGAKKEMGAVTAGMGLPPGLMG
jgi:DNA-binding protein YbaB